ncbi:MAG: hypothetical protein ACJATI_003242 [Halioglobus sp.]|jgi:hypothetical protein
MVGEVTFLYRNHFTLNNSFVLNQAEGKLTVDHDYLSSVIHSRNIDDYQVFSFGIGILAICDSEGSVVTIYLSSGLIDAYNLLLAFSRKESLGDKTGYAVREFYRVDPQEDEYGVSIDFEEDKIKLTTYLNSSTFDQYQFLKGLLTFSEEITSTYIEKYPKFKGSAIDRKIIELRLSIQEKFAIQSSK